MAAVCINVLGISKMITWSQVVDLVQVVSRPFYVQLVLIRQPQA